MDSFANDQTSERSDQGEEESYAPQQSSEITISIVQQNIQSRAQINGIEVLFPYPKVYDPQIAYMKSFIQAMDNCENALLQSPTGTGKTMSILSASMAWLLSKKTMRFDGQNSNTTSLKDMYENGKFSKPPKIYYLTRTHTQIKQIVSQVKKSCYRPVVAILGARIHSCIPYHRNKFKDEDGNPLKFTRSQLNAACKNSRSEKKCKYYTVYEKNKDTIRSHFIHKYKDHVPDIEDMVSIGKQCKFCPYYLEKDLAKTADIVIMPYNYILDSNIKENVNNDLNNSVIIFDEGHNIPGMAEDGVSFSLSLSTLRSCIRDLELMKELIQAYGGNRMNAQKVVINLNEAEQIRKLITQFIDYMMDKRTFLVNKKIENQNEAGIKIFELLRDIPTRQVSRNDTNYQFRNGIDDENLSQLMDILERGCDQISEDPRTTGQLDYFFYCISTINLVYRDTKVKANLVGRNVEKYIDCYRVFHVVTEHSPEIQQKLQEKHEIEVKFQCLNPAIGFEQLSKSKPRSIIITSGTLEPLQSFEHELGTPFNVKLVNKHVINGQKQIFTSIVSTGPTAKFLSFSYKDRENLQIILEMGSTIIQMSRLIPNGILLVFASYGWMERCYQLWSSSTADRGSGKNYIQKILENKSIHREPKDGRDLKDVMQKYYADSSTQRGSILFCVCRGKISEGIDFADEKARAVILIGIPYPQLNDPKIVSKRNYLDDKKKKNQGSMSGSAWYNQQATRTFNQAIGRVIRHRKDYGIVLLCDSRYAKMQDDVSNWVREGMQNITQFGRFYQMIPSFLNQAPKYIKELDKLDQMNMMRSLSANSNENRYPENGDENDENQDEDISQNQIQARYDQVQANFQRAHNQEQESYNQVQDYSSSLHRGDSDISQYNGNNQFSSMVEFTQPVHLYGNEDDYSQTNFIPTQSVIYQPQPRMAGLEDSCSQADTIRLPSQISSQQRLQDDYYKLLNSFSSSQPKKEQSVAQIVHPQVGLQQQELREVQEEYEEDQQNYSSSQSYNFSQSRQMPPQLQNQQPHPVPPASYNNNNIRRIKQALEQKIGKSFEEIKQSKKKIIPPSSSMRAIADPPSVLADVTNSNSDENISEYSNTRAFHQSQNVQPRSDKPNPYKRQMSTDEWSFDEPTQTQSKPKLKQNKPDYGSSQQAFLNQYSQQIKFDYD